MKGVYVILGVLAIANASAVVEINLRSRDGENCDTSLNNFEIQDFTVKPWPPSKNENVSMTMKGVVHKDVTFASMEIYVKYSGFDFYHESIPESGSYKAGSTAEIDFKVYFPSIAPPGKYAVDVKVKDTNGNFLNCWEVKFSL